MSSHFLIRSVQCKVCFKFLPFVPATYIMSLKIRKFFCGKFAFRSYTVVLLDLSDNLQNCNYNWTILSQHTMWPQNCDLFNTKIIKMVGSEYVKSWQNVFFVKKFWELLMFFIFVSLRYTALICSWRRAMSRIFNLFTRRTDFSPSY